MRVSRLAFAVLIGLVLAAPSGAGRPPDLSGVWEIDETLSDDPLRRPTVPPRCRGRGTGFRCPRQNPIGRAGAALRRIRQTMETLEIEQDGSDLRIRFADSHERRVRIDGKTHPRDGGVGWAETRAKWKKSALVVQGRTETGSAISETYSLSGDGTLHVDVKFDDARGGKTRMKCVYRRSDRAGG